MHQRYGDQDLMGFATGFDAKDPDSLGWTDMADNPWRAGEAAN